MFLSTRVERKASKTNWCSGFQQNLQSVWGYSALLSTNLFRWVLFSFFKLAFTKYKLFQNCNLINRKKENEIQCFIFNKRMYISCSTPITSSEPIDVKFYKFIYVYCCWLKKLWKIMFVVSNLIVDPVFIDVLVHINMRIPNYFIYFPILATEFYISHDLALLTDHIRTDLSFISRRYFFQK